MLNFLGQEQLDKKDQFIIHRRGLGPVDRSHLSSMTSHSWDARWTQHATGVHSQSAEQSRTPTVTGALSSEAEGFRLFPINAPSSSSLVV